MIPMKKPRSVTLYRNAGNWPDLDASDWPAALNYIFQRYSQRQHLEENPPWRSMWQGLVATWWAERGGASVSVSDLIEIMEKAGVETQLLSTRRLAEVVRRNLLGRVFVVEGSRIRVDSRSGKGNPPFVLTPPR
jgi:hypothetical protein